MSSRVKDSAVFLVVVLSSIGGCNAILDNRPGRPQEMPADSPASSDPSSDPSTSASSQADDGGAVSGGGCADGELACFGACVSANDPFYGCGDVTCAPCKVARATPTCEGRTCAPASCDPGYADCNADPADGCETDLSKATTCGACNAACPATSPFCAPAGGTFQCTSGCAGDAPTLCGTECVNTQSSANHCGACSAACPAVDNGTAACMNGACAFTCKPQFHACGGKCVAVSDPAACGQACTVCPVPQNGVAICADDTCGAQCNAGFADCDASPANGCESELAKDPLNCGACGTSCNGGVCRSGICQLPDGGT